MPPQHTVSVVIPLYNKERYIVRALESVLIQAHPGLEIIVVDDGSADDGAAEVRSFARQHPKTAIRLLEQENRGPGAARNRGLAEATGELIQLMDSDDLWSLNKLEAQARALEASGADFAYSPWLQARLEDGVALYSDAVLQQRALPASRSPLAWFVRGWVVVFQACLFRRSLLDRVGPYREDLMPSEDSELLFRILAHGARPVHVPGALTLYRLHGGYQISQGGMAGERRARDWDTFTAIVAERLDGLPGLSPADKRSWARMRRGAAAPLAERVLRKLRGSAWAGSYQVAAPTADQQALLREIGYTARQVG